MRALIMVSALTVMTVGAIVTVSTQQGKWAASEDTTAQSLIEKERLWAEASCTHSLIVQDILADDFQGTSPNGGRRYTKKDAVDEAKNAKGEAQDCRLDDAKVHFFGDSIALVYGHETATRKSSDGKQNTRSLIWTDTWLKRNGSWQIVAAQDMWGDCK